MAFAVAALGIAAVLMLAQPLRVRTEGALPVTHAEAELPPCSELQGRERERCQVIMQDRPREYESGAAAQERDASSNTGRAARGSGIEGVNSGNTTIAPTR